MQQIMSVWSTLDNGRRLIVIGATIAMFAAIITLSRIASQPSMSLLYSGLDPAAAGEVVASLEQQGVGYEIRAGAIFVDAAQRDSLRLTLASEGLPASNGQGYELLDSLTGFGTTSQMFDAAYWRAKEGELARTIAAAPQVKSARVHISNQSSNPFQRDVKPTASVVVSTNNGTLTRAQAKALKFLVSSAVSGLAPTDVSVIDSRSGVVMESEENGPLGTSDDRAQGLKRNIERILEARVGPGNAVVEVSLETVTEREAIFERRFDPENRVAISSDTEERSTSSSGTQGGGVTVASNLPDGDAGADGNSSSSENSETRERVNYEVSETTRELIRAPGAIKRLSVAVLVDGIQTIDAANGEQTWQPRSDEELEALRELVASTVGFDEERGDTITLKSMEFEPLDVSIPDSEVSLLQSLNIDTMSLIQLAVLAVVALVLGLFVVRPILSKRSTPIPAIAPPPHLDTSTPLTSNSSSAINSGQNVAGGEALTGEIDEGPGPLPGAPTLGEDGGSVGVSESATGGTLIADGTLQADPVERLRSLIDERKDETLEVLRSWMEDKEERV